MSDFRARMHRRLLLATCTLHVPFIPLCAGVFTKYASLPWGSGGAWAGALATTAVLFAPTPRVLARVLDDAPRASAATYAFDMAYFVHWCSAVAFFVPAVLVGLFVFTWRGIAEGVWAVPTHALLGCYIASLALAMFSVLFRRENIQVQEHDVVVSGLPSALEGLRIVHLSDLHIGSLTRRAFIESWVTKTRNANPHLVVLTGDYVTNGTAFHRAIADAVGKLRAPLGVFASMGNHDYFGEGEPLLAYLKEKNVEVLRNRGTVIDHNGAQLYLAGIDDTWTKRDDLASALRDRPQDMCTVLLAHDPHAFHEARLMGVDLTLSGHTHGGQVALPFFERSVSLSHLAHTFHLGFYREGRATLYVHPGIGTTGPPVRLGVAPAVVVHRLVGATSK